MKKTLLRIFTGLLAMVLVFSVVPAQVWAASSYPNTHVNTGDQAADIVAIAVSQAG